MAAFEYRALDVRGKKHRGVLQGDTARQVRAQLREQGLQPLAVDQVRETQSRLGGGLGPGSRALFLRQLGVLLQAGLPLEEALSVSSEQAEDRRLERVVASLRARVREGRPLSFGMGEYPRAFPPMVRQAVAAGEHAGKLEHVLVRLADFAEANREFAQRIQLAALYPVLLGAVSLLVVGGLLGYVVPKVATVFLSLDAELPLLTRVLLGVADFVRSHGVTIAVVLVGLVAATVVAWRFAPSRRRIEQLLVRLPVLGRILRTLDAARFARTLGICLDSGVPIVEALDVSRGVASRWPIQKAFGQVRDEVREGKSLSASLRASGFAPPVLTRLVASGERSGDLAMMLSRAADDQERWLQARLAFALGLLEPVLILFVGFFVLLIVLAILLPIFQLNQLVGA